MKRKLGIAFLLAALMTLLFSFSAHAACSHTSTKYVTTKAATCCTTGTRNKVCTSCGKVLQTGLKVAATGKHASVTTRVSVSPKCTTAGKLSIYCASTNKLVKTQSINALGHSLRLVQTRSASCTAKGYKKYACNRCDYVKTTYTSNPLGHNMKVVGSKAATCTAAGYKNYKCSRCTYAYQDVVAKKGHTPVLKTVVAATCCYKGYKNKVCSTCNVTLQQQAEIIPATKEHANTYSKIEVKPTCTAYGREVFYCGTTGLPYQTKQQKLPHDYQFSSETPATCTTDGCMIYRCTMCKTEMKVPLEAGCRSYRTQSSWSQYSYDSDLGRVYFKKYCPDCNKLFEERYVENVSLDDFNAKNY